MNAMPKADVVIVGLGAAGGIAANVLAKAGYEVVGIEAGPRWTLDDFVRAVDEIGTGRRGRLGEAKYNKELPTWRPDAGSPVAAPLIPPIKMMNGVGGTSIHYGTQSWRLRADDFKARTTTVERYGEAAVPNGSTIADWPLTYDDLEPYYDQVEYLIGVSGKGGENPFESPRARDYPLPPLRQSGYMELAERTMRELGYHPFPQPAAILSEEYNGRPACSYCGFCSSYGCWNHSKSSTIFAIEEAEATGKLEVRTDSRVTRIVSNDKGEVTGVEYLDAQGNAVEQPASVVMLGGYVFENVRLLLLSTGPAYPNGLGNNGGQVGKHYISHSYVGVQGLFPGQRLNLWAGSSGQGVAMDDLNGDNFDHAGLGFVRGAVVFAGTGRLPIAAATTLPPEAPRWGAAYKRWIAENADSVGSVFAQLETLTHESNYLDLDPESTDALGLPVIRVTYDFTDNERTAGAYIGEKLTEIAEAMGATETWWGFPPGIPIPINSHSYGGTRMGEDASTSVVDRHCVSHEAKNLAILGASCFPTTSGYNPTETVQALAWWTADHVAQNFESIAV